MLTRSTALRSTIQGIAGGREALATQFGTMHGWQRGQDERFDEFVEQKRRKDSLDAFDQRVERAFNKAVQSHKVEIWNAHKREMKSTNTKYTPDVLRTVNEAIEARTEYLRDVWSQIDADYRSTDDARQERAAAEISAALRGEPSDYMAWAYEQKHNSRFKGTMGAEADALFNDDVNMPQIHDDEANRYHSLKTNMIEVERNVSRKFGEAGKNHWKSLQVAKDEEYTEKLKRAGEIYKNLLEQKDMYDQGVEMANLNQDINRAAKAQVKFKAALELEDEREKMREAHAEMNKERAELARVRRRDALREAAEMRKAGHSSDDVINALRLKTLNKTILESDLQLQRQRATVQAEKKRYLDLIEKLREDVERREGEEMLATSSSAATGTASIWEEARQLTSKRDAKEAARAASKEALWEKIGADEELLRDNPKTIVHQARIDAMKTHDDIYSKTLPLNMAPSINHARQTDGQHAVGNHLDRFLFKDVYSMTSAMQWGVTNAHDLDATKHRQYVSGDQWHVMDPKTGDIDWRYERKGGGPVLTDKPLYKAGAEYDARRPSQQTWYATPQHSKKHRTPTQAEEAFKARMQQGR